MGYSLMDLLQKFQNAFFWQKRVWNNDLGIFEDEEGLPAGHSSKLIVSANGAGNTVLVAATAGIVRFATLFVLTATGACRVDILDAAVVRMSVGITAVNVTVIVGNGSAVVARFTGAASFTPSANTAFVTMVYYNRNA